MQDEETIKRVVNWFTATFGLRAFPGEIFRISPSASYVVDGKVMLYIERRFTDDRWVEFAKGTISQLQEVVVYL
jgi:hypothetical protein